MAVAVWFDALDGSIIADEFPTLFGPLSDGAKYGALSTRTCWGLRLVERDGSPPPWTPSFHPHARCSACSTAVCKNCLWPWTGSIFPALADRLLNRFEKRGSDSAAAASEPSLGEVYRQYLSDPRHNRCHRTSEAYRTTERWIAEFFGADTPIGAISRERCRAFVDFLMSVPKNANKKYPNLTLAEAVAATAHDPTIPRINAANVNAYLNKFSGAMNWAELEGLIARNPAKGLRIPDRVKRRDKRRPFSAAQLLRIFRAPLFTGCVDDGHGYARRGLCHPRRARFWVPLIALFSGLRLNEICQLDVTDIIELDGVPCFTVRSGLDDDGGQKRVKNLASERVVPIHIDLRRLGLCSFVTKQQTLGHTKLFPEIIVGSNGYRSKNFSQWFSRFLDTCGAREPLTCFHSFRHCFRDGLRASGVSRDISLALGGWANGSSSGDVADAYGNGFPPRLLEDGINRIQFTGLDLSHLAIEQDDLRDHA